MSEVILNSFRNPKTLLISGLTPVLVIFLLFYIDEGYYNINWMRQPGNWIAFGFYLLAFSLRQLITNQLILGRYSGAYKITFTNLIGIPLGFVLILAIFYFAAL